MTGYRCIACKAPVEKNFDHVGDCDGVCHGTFSHTGAYGRFATTARCPKIFADLPHELVEQIP
jgi:hypothetical protein